jgi:hypothetical protein
MENKNLSLEEESEMNGLVKRKMGYHTNTQECRTCEYSSVNSHSVDSFTCNFNKSIPLAVEKNGVCNNWLLANTDQKAEEKVERPLGGIPVVDLTKKIHPQQLNS